MAEFTMPALGADMTEGTITEWLVHPGDRVNRGDIVAVVDTAKAAIEVECFEGGVVERLLVEPGTTVPVGTPLAVIGPPQPAPGTPTAEPAPEALRAPAVPAGKQPAKPSNPVRAEQPAGPATPVAAPAAGPLASPLVRHLAEEAGVDLAAVHGSGPGGRITRADVTGAPGAAAPRPAGRGTAPGPKAATARPPRTRIPATPLARRLAAEAGIDLASLTGTGTGAGGAIRASDVRAAASPAVAGRAAGGEAAPLADASGRREAMRRAVGDLMARSKREIPHYYLSTTVDLSTAIGWLRERNRQLPVPERLVPTALLLKAAARAAREVPELNGFWTDGKFVPAPDVHLGVAVSLRGGGLIAPAIHRAEDLELPELMAKLRDLVARARTGRLRGSETADPTITVTNLGDQGVEAVFGVIYPPQVALVGFGRVAERPWAVDGLLGVRPVVTATLSADHRASDGATGSRYLTAVDRLLQKPEEL